MAVSGAAPPTQQDAPIPDSLSFSTVNSNSTTTTCTAHFDQAATKRRHQDRVKPLYVRMLQVMSFLVIGSKLETYSRLPKRGMVYKPEPALDLSGSQPDA